MVGSLRLTGVAILLFVLVARADAFNGRFGMGSSSVSTSYYYATPTYSNYWSYPSYCVPGPTIVPVPDAPRMPLARPTPAPPSQSAEPPMNQGAGVGADGLKAPIIVTTHSQAKGVAPSLNDRCRVGFWNLTGRNVVLTVDGKTLTLPRDRATTLELDRQFTWAADQQSQRKVSVPDGQATFEVVIR